MDYPYIAEREQIEKRGLNGAFVYSEIFNGYLMMMLNNEGFCEYTLKSIKKRLFFLTEKQILKEFKKLSKDKEIKNDGFTITFNEDSIFIINNQLKRS